MQDPASPYHIWVAIAVKSVMGKAFLEIGLVNQNETCCNGASLILPREAGPLNIKLKNSGYRTQAARGKGSYTEEHRWVPELLTPKRSIISCRLLPLSAKRRRCSREQRLKN